MFTTGVFYTETSPGEGQDTTAPDISGISATGVSASSATINWVTNEPATSKVEYGIGTNYSSSSPVDSSLAVSHSMSISGLKRNTLYNYRVVSADASGNSANEPGGTFRTSARLPKPPKIGNPTASGGNISWASPVDTEGSLYELHAGTLIMKSTLGFIQIPDMASALAAVSSSKNTFHDPNVSAGEAYYYTLFAYDDLSRFSDPVFISYMPESSQTVPPSSNLLVGGTVETTGNARVRSSASGTGQILGSQEVGALGTVISGGIYADGKYWWNIDYDIGPDGWSAEDLLNPFDYEYEPLSAADTTPPAISNISISNVTQNSVNVSWKTDEPADSQLEYGESENYGETTVLNQFLTLEHTASLSMLKTNTEYHFRVKSKDGEGNSSVSGNQTITTLKQAAAADTTPPVISGINSANVTFSSAKIIWTTNEPATSRVEYGTNEEFTTYVEDSTLLTSHSMVIPGLERDTLYYYKIVSSDSSGNISETMTTLSVKTSARLPKVPKVANLYVSNGTLMWTNPVDEEGNPYELYSGTLIMRSVSGFAQTPNTGSALAAVPSPASSYRDTATNPGTSYYYTLFAYDSLKNYSDPVFISWSSSGAAVPPAPGQTVPAPGVGAVNLIRTLRTGDIGSEVVALQNFLISKSFLETGKNTGYFGSLTKAAVVAYQESKGLVSDGVVGPQTRMIINTDDGTPAPSPEPIPEPEPVSPLEPSPLPTPSPSTAPGGANPTLNITRTLRTGMTGSDVSALQEFLMARSYLSIDKSTGYFGPLTRAAVRAYQCEKLQVCSGDEGSTGYGQVGPKTRATLNAGE